MVHLAHECADQSRAAAAEGMAERDGPAVDVDPVLIQAEQANACERLRGERLVQLHDLHVGGLQAGLLERFERRGHRSNSHVVGMHSGGRCRHEPRQRLQASLPGLRVRHQDQRCRAVVQRRCVTRGDRSVFPKRGLQLGERFQRRVGPRSLVVRDCVHLHDFFGQTS